MSLAAALDLPYLDAFPLPQEAAWRAAVDKVLKGADFEKRLVGISADGIRIEPLYAAAAISAPATRSESGRWRVAARVDHPEPNAAREIALADLEGGADTLSLSFTGTRAARGFGLIANDVAALGGALDGVMLDLIRVRLDPAPLGRINAELVARLIEDRGLAPSALAVEFGLDPIGVFASHGGLATAVHEMAHPLAETITSLKERGFKGPFVTIDTRPYHEAGASEAQELGAAMATAVAYLRALEAEGLSLADARDALAFTLVADTDEFMTIAKFRAARLMWNHVQQACGLQAEPAAIHAETAWRSLTRRDPWVNLLRGTIAAFAAGVGGADSLGVQPFTAAIGLPDLFARRIARNTQLILLEEANLWRVADPAAGAGGFEALTQALCEKGWSIFQDIEAQAADGLHGILAGLINGFIAKGIASQRTAREKAIATRRQPITGASEFANIDEEPVSVLKVDRSTERTAEPERQADDRAPAIDPLPSLRLAEPFERLRDLADELSQRPKVFLATLGSIADFTARASFARNLFGAGGLAASSGDGFAADGTTNVESLAAAFEASGTRLACLCGSDAAYEGEGVAVAQALAKAGATVWLAGRPRETEALTKAGVSSFIFVGCDVLETLERAQAIAAFGRKS